MLNFIEIAKTIPGAVWGTIFGAIWGSFFGLLTSTLTERRTAARARDQRDHDSMEKTRDRAMTLRREAYLPMAAEINEAMGFLGRMPNHTIEEIGKGEPLSRLSSAASKLALVSSSKTAIAVNNLSTECNLLYLRFSSIAMEIAAIVSLIGTHEALRQERLTEMGRLNSAMAAINASGEPDGQKFQALQRQYEAANKLFADQSKKIDDANAQRQALHTRYGTEFLPAVRALLDDSLSLMISMRQDLGQDEPGHDFAKQAKANVDRIYSLAEAALRANQCANDRHQHS